MFSERFPKIVLKKLTKTFEYMKYHADGKRHDKILVWNDQDMTHQRFPEQCSTLQLGWR